MNAFAANSVVASHYETNTANTAVHIPSIHSLWSCSSRRFCVPFSAHCWLHSLFISLPNIRLPKISGCFMLARVRSLARSFSCSPLNKYVEYFNGVIVFFLCTLVVVHFTINGKFIGVFLHRHALSSPFIRFMFVYKYFFRRPLCSLKRFSLESSLAMTMATGILFTFGCVETKPTLKFQQKMCLRFGTICTWMF